MNTLRKHWYDFAGILAAITLLLLFFFHTEISDYQLLMWLSLLSLFLHQLEEYRIAGTFPGMVNKVMFNSDMPDRFPLNSNTSLIINVWIGWTVYLIAALAAERLIWLGMATILISLGNIIAHTLIFNIKGRTIYNAGMVTCWLFFAPCVFFFFKIIHQENLASTADYVIGIPLGVLINVFGIMKLIQWLANRNTTFIFSSRHLLAEDR